MPELADLLAVFDLEPTGEGAFSGSSIVFGGGSVVFGGQLLAQSILAGATVDPAKEVKSIHTVFARGAATDAPLEFDVDVMQNGRSFASASVTARQGERLCTRSLVLLHAPDPDLIRHQPEAPAVGSPEDAVASEHSTGFW
jgi:acyl-CoA thioesterase II